MMFPVVGIALLLHVAFWGTGLAMLTMPRPWRRFWPALVMPAGFLLQSLVVWLGAYANLPGTNSYAWPSEIVPVVLLVLGLLRFGPRAAWLDLGRFGVVALVMAGVFCLLVVPLMLASHALTSVSLGSCDAADYAAGARVFMEFAHADRGGFLGLTEVVRVSSVDNFYDFWLRLNHFTPSAVMALNGSILRCAPHEIASLFVVVVLVSSLPVVFWMSRAVFGYTGGASLIIAGLYGISPITWYSVAHVSPAPLLAAQAIALLSWSGVTLWNNRLTWHRALPFCGVLAIGYGLVLGSYNFILLVSLVPAVAYAGARMLRTGNWRRFVRWLILIGFPFVPCAFIFWARVAGLVERFMLFRTYDFGWRIPALTPEGWLGMVQGGSLLPWLEGGLRWLLSVVLVTAFGWALVRAIRRDRRRVWLIASVTLPVLCGYVFLEVRGAMLGTNASYDAFKLLTVFYPLLLPAFCWWITLRWSGRLLPWFAVAALAVVVVGFNAVACGMFIYRLSRPPLLVDRELRQLRTVDRAPEISSINMLIPDMWSRLWANAFLLHKPQYFPVHTYEGRLNTALRGDWDIEASTLRVDPSGSARQNSPHFWLVDTHDPAFVRQHLLDGWYAQEQAPNGDRWRWAQEDARFQLENPHGYPVSVNLVLDGRGFGERDITVSLQGSPPASTVHIGDQRQKTSLGALQIPPGRSVIVLHSRQPAGQSPGDSRKLSLCVFSLTISTSKPD